jgi:hypothetical protein
VITAGTPNLLTHPRNKALAQSTGVVAAMGMASSQRDALSIIVKKWVKPFDGGRGPTRSSWMWLKLHVGMGMGCMQWYLDLAVFLGPLAVQAGSCPGGDVIGEALPGGDEVAGGQHTCVGCAM